MSSPLITPLPTSDAPLPACFPSPFAQKPAAVAEIAALDLQRRLAGRAGDEGAMHGVLVVRDDRGALGYLAAVAGGATVPGFVPPLDEAVRGRLVNLFQRLPIPHGIGDCAATRLLHYALDQGYAPIALAEFWWGASPAMEVRHHGRFYPACRGRCGVILPRQLEGIAVEPPPLLGSGDGLELATLYEDEAIIVVDKPHGLLSVPGKQVHDSVLTRLQQRYPEASGALLLHRLDMSTSGLLLAAKRSELHKALQRQFERRTIDKRYVAVVEGCLPDGVDEGRVELPLRVDLDDRPRQLVCREHGKPAVTRWRVVERGADTTRLYLYPHTGRTHQLRLHTAHRQGLAAPIVGDELYGTRGGRLLLHAERLRFTHPLSGERVEVHSPPPF